MFQRIASIVLALGSLGADGSKQFIDPGGRFSLRAPANWSMESHGEVLLLQAPGGEIAIAFSTYLKPGGTLESFAHSRMAVEAEIYKRTGALEEFSEADWSGVLEHAEGVYPGESAATHRVVLCAKSGDVFLSAAAYTSAGAFPSRRVIIESVLRSLRFKKARPN